MNPTHKGNRKPKPVTTRVGPPITLWHFMGMMQEQLWKRNHHGPGRSVYLLPEGMQVPHGATPKVVSVHYLSSRPFFQVVQLAQQGRLCTVEYLPNAVCRCRGCDRAKVKKPRGPKMNKDGTFASETLAKYRGAMSVDALQALWDAVSKEKKLT